MFNAFKVIENIARCGRENQQRNPGDYEDQDGLLICGKCGEPRQKVMTFANPTEDEPFRTDELIIATMCKCEREQEEKELQRKRASEDMEKIRKLRGASLMDEKFADSTFEQFKITKHNGQNLKLCQRYAERFDAMIEKTRGCSCGGM